jgi:YbgC/YbaW family acyl-CoA thioester hydrolase
MSKALQRTDFRFADRLRVRWAEIDAQKIVFNGHYLMYVDTAVAAYWRTLALPYAETMASLDGDLYVKKATLEYHASARYDEQLEVGIRCERIGTSSLLFRAGVFRASSLLVSGELVYVFANPQTQTSQAVPQSLRDVIQGFEAGEPMVRPEQAAWAECSSEVRALRHAVFVEELGLPAELAEDALDAKALQVLVRNRYGLLVATGRAELSTQESAWPGDSAHAVGGDPALPTVRLSRLAVVPLLRGAGIGRALLAALEAAALNQGAQQVVLAAPLSAVGFYQRAGYQCVGEPTQHAGLAHQALVKRLTPRSA